MESCENLPDFQWEGRSLMRQYYIAFRVASCLARFFHLLGYALRLPNPEKVGVRARGQWKNAFFRAVVLG